ncbi:dentin sialophosphoprotein-like [Mizuhopecten yessoensis]|uniref:dentin sialophosphoprotein-like n=1 Tax=Mizuhopecten yessoensis TaxID=6573 RepID=UPI000B45D38F|nr:dentin sialophosphoprotein-like [Mizuhopecten yessoensis]
MSRFDVEKFDPAPDPDLICCICQCVLDSPMESPCRHVFCKICIETWLTNHHNCPTCRRSLRTRRLKPVLPLVQNMINRLQMSCDFSTNGCKEILILEQYDSHLKVCDYEKLKCRFSKCGIELLRKDLSEHEEDLCEFREKRCIKQCGLMIPISVYETHDCFVELQKFATESTALVDTLKKSVKELTELTKTMKKNLEDLSRELQGRRNRSPLSSPSYSPSYSFTSSGDESDLSNFILDDYSNDRFGDDHNNDRHIPEITTALQMYMDRTQDQRTVRWRSRNPSRNVQVIDLVQPANINTTEQAINSANGNVSIQGASAAVAAAEVSSRSNNSDVNGNQVLGPSTAANGQSTLVSRQERHQSNEPISPTRVSTRSRSHIWDSDISVLSSSSSSSSSSSDDDVDRDFGIDREEDGGQQDRDRNSDRYSYSFSSTPINSPDRSVRSGSSSGSTICNDDHGSPSVHSVISSSHGSNQSMSEIYTDDEGDGSYCSSRSANPARVSDTRQQPSYSSDQHTLINQSSQSIDSSSSKDGSNMDRSRNHITKNSRTIHNSSLNQSGHSLYYQINHNSSMDRSTHTVESEQEHISSIEHSSHSESSRLEGHTSRNRSGASVESNSDQNSDFKTNPIASFSSGVTSSRNLSYCSSDQEYRQQDLRNQTASDQNDVIVVSVENGSCPIPGLSVKKLKRRGNATSTTSACGGMSPSVDSDSCITNTTSPHKLDNTVNDVKEKKYVQVDSSINSSSTGRSPCPLSTQRPIRKRKHASNSCCSSNSSQERSPSPKKRLIYPSEAAFTNKTKGRGHLGDNANVPENVSAQSSGEGMVSGTCQQQVQVSGLSVENMRASVITSSHVEGETTCVATNNTTISSKELVANKPVSSSYLTEKNPVVQLSNISVHDISGQRECIATGFSQGNTHIEVPVSENITMENRNTDPNLDATFDLREYNSDTDDTWEPLDSVVDSNSDLDYQGMLTDTDDTDNTNGAWQNLVNGQESVAANTGSSRSESDDTWEPRISRDDNSNSEGDDDSYLSELDIDTDSSYEVRIPMSVAQLLDKYASEDHDSDDSWTPH